jgi:hypothetical protein
MGVRVAVLGEVDHRTLVPKKKMIEIGTTPAMSPL